jgi:hypothetical protein
MYVVIEPSGIHVRDGLVVVRFTFYLEPFDLRYNECYVQVIDDASEDFKGGYQGKVDEMGRPINRGREPIHRIKFRESLKLR